MAGPRLLVDSPSPTNPLPYGLLSVAEPVTDRAGGKWENGITWEASCIVTGGTFTTYDECITVTGAGAPTPPPPPAKSDNVDRSLRGATPFTVFTRFDCSVVGDSRVARNQAEDALAKVEGWQVERAVWTGLAGGQVTVWPHLAANADVTLTDQFNPVILQTASTPVTGSAMKMTLALGLLEEAMGICFGGQGVVHIPAHAFPVLAGAFGEMLTQDSSGHLRTQRGNLIAVGTGYPGTSPAGAARPSQTQTWIYGTAPVFAFRSPIRVIGDGAQMDRANNTRSLIAERTYLVGWECCQFAALVDLNA